MNRLSAFTALLVLVAFAGSGQGIAALKGQIKDSAGAVELANVVLFAKGDTTRPVAFCISDSLGGFAITAFPVGKYILQIQRIGYLPVRMELVFDNRQIANDVGIIILQPNNEALQNVTFIGRRKLIQKTSTGFVIRAEDNLTQAAGTVVNLLANTPTVLVDAEGAIRMRGKVPQILINGRNSVLGAKSLDRIPASSIDRIEIINNPTAQYDADAESGIINIVLKKQTRGSSNGAFGMGGGYGTAGRFNSSLLLNYQTGKWELGMGYDNRFASRHREVNGDRVNFNLPDQYYLTQRRFDDRTERTHNLRLNAGFAPNKYNTLELEAIYSYDYEHNYETLTSTQENINQQFTNRNDRISDELPEEHAVELALSFKRTFDQSNKSFSAMVSTSLAAQMENTQITTQGLDENFKPVNQPYLQQTSNDEETNVTNVRFDFAQPMSKKAFLETGYKGIFRWLDADFKSLNEVNGGLVPNPKASNLFRYNEQVQAGYVQYNALSGTQKQPTWKYVAGLRFEQVFNHGESSGSQSFSNNYFNIFPTANISRYLSEDAFLKFNYNRRINRPGLGQLNPFVDITDSLNPHGGNPYLQPELVHALEFGYSKDWDHFSLGANLFYRKGTNTIFPYTSIDSAGVALITPMNFGSSVTYGLEAIFTAQAGKVWNATANLSLFQQNIEGEKDNNSISNEVFSWYVKMVNNFTFWPGNKIQVAANYQAPTATPQGKRIAIYNVDFGMQQSIWKGKGRLGITVTDIFNTQMNGYNMVQPGFTYSRTSKIDTRAVLLTFGYTFGAVFREKLMDNQFSNE